ncbi:hypothetical protein ACFFJY_08130 [Fictibacillus aquaticus]|uniref:Uncharacterized protein n=1 Tax=Fictibacillus aquaticus TaxID=2021314 RepID=A0A235F9L6_9BACL|nr:hypothetical protein [Fictibacillus aquaticus]OYD57859.1 hypothetical protein CGZ90_08125 [Fictibacillus aquaticus]
MVNLFQKVGIIIIASGILAGLYIGTSLEVVTPGLTAGYENNDPHPLRLIYAFFCMITSLFFGCTLIAVTEILHRLEPKDVKKSRTLQEQQHTTT